MPDVTDDHTKKDQDDTIRLDDLTKGKMESQIQYETHLREAFRDFSDMPKILAPLTKLLPEPEKGHRRPYDVLKRPHEWPMFSRSEPNLKISIIVFPSCVKFGTV